MRKLEERWSTWGWYSTLYQVAKTGQFTRAGLTPLESVYAANFWEVMIFLANQNDYANI